MIGRMILLTLCLASCTKRGQAVTENGSKPHRGGEGGGSDTSGGNTLTSSAAEVDESLKDIDRKAYNALERISGTAMSSARYQVDKDFGVGLFDLFQVLK